MNTLRTRRLYVILGALMVGAGTGATADLLADAGNSTASPVLPMLLAGLGLGIMVASVLRD